VETKKTAGEYETSFTARDRRVLKTIIRHLSPLLPPPESNRGKRGTPYLWRRLVSQVCVMGSAVKLERLDEEQKSALWGATSLGSWKARKFSLAYMQRELEAATRFPGKAASRLLELTQNPHVVQDGEVVVLRELRGAKDADSLRSQLLARFGRSLGRKSVSDFMIATGLSQDVLALDQRLVGFFNRHLDYALAFSRVQGSDAVYRSVESALRPVCAKEGISLAQFDRMIFKYAGMPAANFLIERHVQEG